MHIRLMRAPESRKKDSGDGRDIRGDGRARYSRDLQVSSQDIGFQVNEISDQDEVEEILAESEPGEQSK